MPITVPSQIKDRVATFVYHKNIPTSAVEKMEEIRQRFVNLAAFLIATLPEGRPKSLALTHLEDAQMRAIQALALQGVPDADFVEM